MKIGEGTFKLWTVINGGTYTTKEEALREGYTGRFRSGRRNLDAGAVDGIGPEFLPEPHLCRRG